MSVRARTDLVTAVTDRQEGRPAEIPDSGGAAAPSFVPDFAPAPKADPMKTPLPLPHPLPLPLPTPSQPQPQLTPSPMTPTGPLSPMTPPTPSAMSARHTGDCAPSVKQYEGQYAVATVSADTWLSTPIVPSSDKGRSRKVRSNKQVLHPIFAECAKQTADPWWQEKFASAAYGKMPSKLFSYKDGLLIYSKRNNSKVHTLEVPPAPYEAYHACKEFFAYHGNIVSALDQAQALREQKARAERELSKEPKTWTGYSKVMKEALIEYYIEDMARMLALHPAEVKNLRYCINISILFGNLSNDNFQLEGGRLVAIRSVFFDQQTRTFFVETSEAAKNAAKSKAKAHTKAKKSDQKLSVIESKWIDYVNYLDKKRLESTKSHARVVSVRGDRPSTDSESDGWGSAKSEASGYDGSESL